MRTILKYFRVDRRRINMLRFTLEAYEGVAVVTTLDPEKGLIVLAIAPGCEPIVEEVMADLGRNFLIEPCSAMLPQGSEKIYG
ncbi:MAG: DUF4911 domain-containing protein [Desulfobacteraceae bacterium]|nr:DUF4911 domain-containing protein [Desulfobacteraceae bacterium]